MGPYVKCEGGMGWVIEEGDGNVIADLETETLADAALMVLLGEFSWIGSSGIFGKQGDVPNYDAETPYGVDETEEDEDETEEDEDDGEG